MKDGSCVPMKDGNRMRRLLAIIVSTTLLSVACGGGNTGPQSAKEAVPGAPETAKTATLVTAANMLQSKGPVTKLSLYLDGFHAAKDNPKMQMEEIGRAHV